MQAKTLGRRLRRLRKINGETQREFAENFGRHYRTVQNWESDHSVPDVYSVEIPNPTSSTPSHYQGTIQPIDLINAQNLNFNLGNVVKYVCRAGKKQGENVLSDLEKAKNYINYEIERIKKNE